MSNERGIGMEEHNLIGGAIRLYCDKENIESYLENIILQLRLEKGFFHDSITDSDIVFGEAFGDLQISSLILKEDCLNLELTGKIKPADPWSLTYGTITVLKSGILDGTEDAAILIDVVTPGLRICYAEMKQEGNHIIIPVTIQKGEFTEVSNIDFGDIRIEDIEYVDNSTINIHVLCNEEENFESMIDSLPEAIIKISQKTRGEELNLETVFSVPKKYVDFEFLYKDLENFDENSEYENGYTGILTLGFRFSINGIFENNLCDYVKLNDNFAGGSIRLKSLDRNVCEIELLIALEADNSDDFFGMILNGSIVLEKGFAYTEWGTPFPESVYLHEVMLHDQLGGASEVWNEISVFTSEYAETFSSIGKMVSSVSSLLDFSIKFAELVGWKESMSSVLKDIRNELGELKGISQETLATVNWIKNKMIEDTHYSVISNFNVELENLNSSCTQFFNIIHDNMELLETHSSDEEISAAFQKGIDVVMERYGARLEVLINSYNLLMKKLTGTLTGLPQEINPFHAADILINEQFNWDIEALPLRNLYRSYVGSVLTRGYLLLKAMSLTIKNNHSNVEYLDRTYSSITSYIDSHQSDEKRRNDSSAYNLVLGKYVYLISDKFANPGDITNRMFSIIKPEGSDKQYAEMLRRTKNKRLYNDDMIKLGTNKMRGELNYVFMKGFLTDDIDFLFYKPLFRKDKASTICELFGEGIALNTDCIEQQLLYGMYYSAVYINNAFVKNYNKKFVFFRLA